METAKISILITILFALFLTPTAETASQKEEKPEYSVTVILRSTEPPSLFLRTYNYSAINNFCQIASKGTLFRKVNETLEGFIFHGNRWQKGNIQVLNIPRNRRICWKITSFNNLGQLVGKLVDRRCCPAGAVFWDGEKVRKLGAFKGWTLIRANDINDKGQITGTAKKGNSSYPFLWERGDIFLIGMSELNPLERYSGCLINNQGKVVIWSRNFFGKIEKSYIWRKGEKIRELGTLGGNSCIALDINDQGQIVGISSLNPSEAKKKKKSLEKKEPSLYLRVFESVKHGFLWEDGKIKDLGTLPGYLISQANAINNQGQIVGWSANCDPVRDVADVYIKNTRAVLWQEGKVFDLNSLIPSYSGWFLLVAYDINDKGQILVEGIPTGGKSKDKALYLLLLEPIKCSPPSISPRKGKEE